MPELVRLKGRHWTSELREKYGPLRGWLTDDQIGLIVKELKDRSLTHYDIADRWLISLSTVRQIAAAHGVKRYRERLSSEQRRSLLDEIKLRERSYATLATQYGLKPHQVQKFAVRQGVRRPHVRKLDSFSPEQREQILALAEASDAPYEEIAKRFNLTARVVNDFALANGVRRGQGRQPLTKRQQSCR